MLAGIILAVLLGVACSGPTGTASGPTAASTPTATTSTGSIVSPGGAPTVASSPAATVSEACAAAFAAAAAVSSSSDTVEDLDPAVKACETLTEWTAAAVAYPDALDTADPREFLGNRCLYGEGLASTALCSSLATP